MNEDVGVCMFMFIFDYVINFIDVFVFKYDDKFSMVLFKEIFFVVASEIRRSVEIFVTRMRFILVFIVNYIIEIFN